MPIESGVENRLNDWNPLLAEWAREVQRMCNSINYHVARIMVGLFVSYIWPVFEDDFIGNASLSLSLSLSRYLSLSLLSTIYQHIYVDSWWTRQSSPSPSLFHHPILSVLCTQVSLSLSLSLSVSVSVDLYDLIELNMTLFLYSGCLQERSPRRSSHHPCKYVPFLVSYHIAIIVNSLDQTKV